MQIAIHLAAEQAKTWGQIRSILVTVMVDSLGTMNATSPIMSEFYGNMLDELQRITNLWLRK